MRTAVINVCPNTRLLPGTEAIPCYLQTGMGRWLGQRLQLLPTICDEMDTLAAALTIFLAVLLALLIIMAIILRRAICHMKNRINLMTIQPAVDISRTLSFNSDNKNLTFSPAITDLLSEVFAATQTRSNNIAEDVGYVLATHLNNKSLVTKFNWNADQPYYDRFILYGDNRRNATVMALIWPAKQFSPVHYHRSWCVFGPYTGTLTELVYPAEKNKTIGDATEQTNIYHAGDWTFDDAKGPFSHALGNAEENPVLSFHIYGVGPKDLDEINCELI
jgi:predicted metal-dependent enzyme (double-stranded beta helix superfamily)